MQPGDQYRLAVIGELTKEVHRQREEREAALRLCAELNAWMDELNATFPTPEPV